MSLDRIRSHDSFFQMFVDQIPKDIYHAEENSDMNTKYFKHRKAPLTTDEKKVLSKKRKSEKYGLNGEEVEGDDEEDDNIVDNDDEIGIEEKPSKSQSTKIPASFASLSLSKSKKNKEHSNKVKAANQANPNHNSSSGQSSAKSNNNPNQALAKGSTNNEPYKPTTSPVQTPEELHQSLLLEASRLTDVDLDIDMNEVKSSGKSNNAGKPGSKVRRLKRMLQEADAKRQRLESLKRSGIDGHEQAQKELWADALIDASGAKSVTDTGKLRKALKRIDKSKEKSTREWQDRLDVVQEAQSSRLDRREQNLKNRKSGGPMISSKEKDSTGEAYRKHDGKSDGKGDGKGDDRKDSNHSSHHSYSHGHGNKGTTSTLMKPLSSKHGGGGKPGFDKKLKNRPGFEGKKKHSSERFLNSPRDK